MQTFSLHPLVAAILVSVLVMGAIGAFAVVPIVCINWVWNTVVAQYTVLHRIEIWQACLLYAAAVCSAYLLGIVRIEIEAESVD